jgi:hypothetical protein
MQGVERSLDDSSEYLPSYQAQDRDSRVFPFVEKMAWQVNLEELLPLLTKVMFSPYKQQAMEHSSDN